MPHFSIPQRNVKAFPILIAACLVAMTGCGSPPAPMTALDSAYLTSSLWNDGLAEVAFYRITRQQDQYGRDVPQSFMAGTYLVKHDFDEATESKARSESTTGVPAFKYALFYEFESGSYEYKRNWVVNAAQRDLRSLKASFSGFDWCSNQYQEYAFSGNAVDYLYRSDDYGNAAEHWTPGPGTYPIASIPLLVRAVVSDTTRFGIITPQGNVVGATAVIEGPESFRDSFSAVRVKVTYDQPVPSMIGEESALTESWLRSTDPDRRILAMRSGDGRYRMELVEHLRSAYWQENLYDRLSIVTQRP